MKHETATGAYASGKANILINNQVSGDASKNDNDQKELIKEEGKYKIIVAVIPAIVTIAIAFVNMSSIRAEIQDISDTITVIEKQN